MVENELVLNLRAEQIQRLLEILEADVKYQKEKIQFNQHVHQLESSLVTGTAPSSDSQRMQEENQQIINNLIQMQEYLVKYRQFQMQKTVTPELFQLLSEYVVHQMRVHHSIMESRVIEVQRSVFMRTEKNTHPTTTTWGKLQEATRTFDDLRAMSESMETGLARFMARHLPSSSPSFSTEK